MNEELKFRLQTVSVLVDLLDKELDCLSDDIAGDLRKAVNKQAEKCLNLVRSDEWNALLNINEASVELCNCGENPAQEPHPCPFAQEMTGDDSDVCTCCDDCTYECAMDV